MCEFCWIWSNPPAQIAHAIQNVLAQAWQRLPENRVHTGVRQPCAVGLRRFATTFRGHLHQQLIVQLRATWRAWIATAWGYVHSALRHVPLHWRATVCSSLSV